MDLPFFHVTRVEIVNRKTDCSTGKVKVVSKRVYTPVKNDLVIQSEARNVIANNYLKSKQTNGGRKPRRRLKRPNVFPNYYTNREVLKISCSTYPK